MSTINLGPLRKFEHVVQSRLNMCHFGREHHYMNSLIFRRTFLMLYPVTKPFNKHCGFLLAVVVKSSNVQTCP